MLLKEDKYQFELEQDHLLTTVLDLRFFDPWKNDFNEFSIHDDAGLEIYITNVCNQQCEYCYLIKHPELYPSDKRDPKLIIHNLRLLYDYIIEQEFSIPKIEFFSGEIWQSNFGLEILDVTLEYLRKGMRIGWFLTASNCSFIFNKQQTQKIQTRIDQFNALGSPFCFSISVDGKYIDDFDRKLTDFKPHTDEFYDDLFAFAKHNTYGFHPMVAAVNIEYWDQNYTWWKEQLNKYDLELDSLMMLEVRNNDWTDEKIDIYLKLLKRMIDEYYERVCSNDIEIFSYSIFNISGTKFREEKLAGYTPWMLADCDTFIGCTAGVDLTVRLGDLAICPCHRTAYNKYLYGKFIVENDKIVDIKANNPQMAIQILMANFLSGTFKCDQCIYNNYCLKGCLGSQLETMGDPFILIPSVCHFSSRKMEFIFQTFKDMGVFECYKKIPETHPDYDRVQKLLRNINDWEDRK